MRHVTFDQKGLHGRVTSEFTSKDMLRRHSALREIVAKESCIDWAIG